MSYRRGKDELIVRWTCIGPRSGACGSLHQSWEAARRCCYAHIKRLEKDPCVSANLKYGDRKPRRIAEQSMGEVKKALSSMIDALGGA